MNKILIPVDFSKHSQYACVLAAKIAKKSNSEVHLLHMVELPRGIVDMGAGSNFSIPESMLYIRKVRDKLIDLKNQYFNTFDDIQHAIRFQNPYEGIRDYAKKISADLIVMGSKGQTALEEILIGSNTEKTVRSLDIPTLVTKKEDANFKFEKLVFASTFENDEAKALEGFLEFAKNFESELYFLKINTPQKFESTSSSRKKVADFIAKYDIDNYAIRVYNDNTVEEGILNFSEEENVDMIALATHGRSGLSRFFNGSVSLNLSKNVLKPVLTFRV
ncbi:Universal stress protein [Tenacibaculum litopenaei]|jgi:nucleotide-binding universal stress UspA family protein|uniref:universal stress protein n=1 Tax=Tenacibaculum litopenaei TaxID=396016 RepID=UPI003893C364